MIKIERGEEIDGPSERAGRRHGIFHYSCPEYPDVQGYSRQPLSDACRQLIALGVDPETPIGRFRAGHTIPSVTSTVGVAAALTIQDGANRGPGVARWKAFSRADVEPSMRSNDGPVPDPPP